MVSYMERDRYYTKNVLSSKICVFMKLGSIMELNLKGLDYIERNLCVIIYNIHSGI